MPQNEAIELGRKIALSETGLLPKCYKVWSSSLDGCGCSLCARLEGTALPLNEPFVIAGRSVQAPPLHEECRCVLLYEENLKPAPYRDLEAFRSFAELANGSGDFIAAVNGYHSAVFFLERLSACSDAELSAAGLSASGSLKAKLQELLRNKDGVINGAIKRAHDRVVRDASELKTERGRRARMERSLQLILSSQELSAENYRFLRSVYEDEGVSM